MKRTQEEMAAALADPAKALFDLYPAAKNVTFNVDPETAKTEQLLLYYYLDTSPVRRLKPESKAKKFQSLVDSVMDRSDEFSRYALSLKGDARNRMREDLVSVYGEDLRVTSEFSSIDVTGKVLRDPLGYANTFMEGLLAPKVTAEGLEKLGHDFKDVNNKMFVNAVAEEEKQLLARKPMQVPKGLTDREVTMMTTGCLMSDHNLQAVVDNLKEMAANGIRGSSLYAVGSELRSVRDTFFSNTFTKDMRQNMQASRLTVNRTRTEAETALKAYEDGNPQPFVDNLKRAFTASMGYTRTITNMRYNDGYTALSMAVEAADMLQNPKFAKYAKMTPEEEQFADNCRAQLKTVKEAAELKSELFKYSLEHYYDTNLAPDPKIEKMIDRWGEISMPLNYSGRKTDVYIETTPSQYSLVAQDDYKASRPIDAYEKAVMGKNDAVTAFLNDKFKNSDFRNSLVNAKSGRDMFVVLSGASKTTLAPVGLIDIELELNHGLKNKLSKDVAHDPEENRQLQALMNTVLSGGNTAVGNLPYLKEHPTAEQLLERKQLYDGLIDQLNKRFPGEVKGIGQTGYETDVKRDVIGTLELTKTAIDTYLKNIYPEKQTIAAVETLMKQEKNARETGESIRIADGKGKTLSNIDAAKLLAGGKSVQMEKFQKGRFVGVRQAITFKKNGELAAGKSQPVFRSVNYQVEQGTVADQMQSLHFVKDMLDGTQSFFVKNSKEFNSLMKSLNEVIKAQENIGENANIRQVKSLNEMYDKLHKDAKAYVDYKKASVKDSDVRGRTRLAGIESLMSVTDPKYVRSLASRSYLEQQRLTAQTRDGREALKLMDDLGERFLKVSNPREMPTADKKMLLTGFDKVVDYIAAQRQSGMDTDYLALGMAGSFKSIKIMRDSIGAFPLTPEREQIARNFADQCDRMAGKYAGMSPDIAPKPAAPVKTIEAPKVKPGN